MAWGSALIWAALVVIAILLLLAVFDAMCVINLTNSEKCAEKFKETVGEGVGEGISEAFTYTQTKGPLPYQRPAMSLPGPSPTYGPLVNPLEKAVAEGVFTNGLSVLQQPGPGMYSPDTQIDERCRAACDADPTCGSYATFNTIVDRDRGLYGRACHTYTNTMYGPSTYPTVFATQPKTRAELVADGYVPPQGVADLFVKQAW